MVYVRDVSDTSPREKASQVKAFAIDARYISGCQFCLFIGRAFHFVLPEEQSVDITCYGELQMLLRLLTGTTAYISLLQLCTEPSVLISDPS